MPTYEMTFKCAGGIATLAPIAALRATTRKLRLKEIRVVNASTTATEVGLYVSQTGTITPNPTFSFTPNPRDPGDAAATALVDTAWTASPAGPTSPAQYNRAEPLAGVVGSGVSWPFPDPQVIPKLGQIQVFNSAGGTNGAVNVTFVYDE